MDLFRTLDLKIHTGRKVLHHEERRGVSAVRKGKRFTAKIWLGVDEAVESFKMPVHGINHQGGPVFLFGVANQWKEGSKDGL